MEDFDLTVTKVTGVVHRISNSSWRANNLYNSNEFIIVIALDGKAFYDVNGNVFPVEKNDVLIFRPKVLRTGWSDKSNPWEFITIMLSLSLNNTTDKFLKDSYFHFKETGERLRNKFLDIAYAWEGKKPLYQIKCKNLVSSVLYELLREQLPQRKIPHAKKLELTREYIQKNFRSTIDVEKLAEESGLSQSYFRKLFKEAYGVSPMEYITDLRINTACDLLASGDVNITEAASLSGFDDIYYFSKLFKKQTGFSPTKYKNQY